MRKIEQDMVNAIRNNEDFRSSNTEVTHEGNIVKVYLHGNLIYAKNKRNGKVMFSSCGWNSNTTKSRLNALGANIKQKNWGWYNMDGSIFEDGKLSDIM